MTDKYNRSIISKERRLVIMQDSIEAAKAPVLLLSFHPHPSFQRAETEFPTQHSFNSFSKPTQISQTGTSHPHKQHQEDTRS